MANASISTVQFLYKRVIDETIRTSRETFQNEGIEDSVLAELRTLWESKVSATRAVEPPMNPPDYIPRGQIYKYNYRSQAPQQQQQQQQQMPAGSTPSVTPFPGHLSAFMPGSIQRPQHPGPRQVLAARPQQQAQTRPNIPGSSSSSQFPSSSASIPFPSLSGVTTVTKKEFNNASDSIQVDGSVDLDEVEVSTEEFQAEFGCDGPVRIRSVIGSGGVLEIHRNKIRKSKKKRPMQLDGVDSEDDAGEFIDSDESEDEEDNDTDEEIDVESGERGVDFEADSAPVEPVEEDDPLNSDDDDSDNGSTEFEATDNVVVCLFDKITRSKNKWKLYLKDGVMNISGKDHVFQKAIGDGEW